MKNGCRRWSAGPLPYLVPVLFLFLCVSFSDACSVKEPPEKINVIMVGDRLIDVAYNLGVVPEAVVMRASMWPDSAKISASTLFLGCPNSVLTKKKTIIADTASEKGIKKVFIEKNPNFCTYMPDVKLGNVEKQLEGKGIEVTYVDFSNGVENAILATGALVGKKEAAEKLAARYAKEMKKVKEMLSGKKNGKKVVILSGTLQKKTGKAFVRVEAPGGYSDRFLLGPLGLENAGACLNPRNKKPSKGFVSVRKLDGLVTGAPDVIIAAGSQVAVQLRLKDAVRKNPALADVPAIRNMEIYSLPVYIDSGVIEYPSVLMTWATVF